MDNLLNNNLKSISISMFVLVKSFFGVFILIKIGFRDTYIKLFGIFLKKNRKKFENLLRYLFHGNYVNFIEIIQKGKYEQGDNEFYKK